METGFKFVAADLMARSHGFSYLDALRTGEWLVASNPTKHGSPCPLHEGDGLCVAHTVDAACSGGQSASSAVGLIVEYERGGILAEGEGKTRVRRLRVVDVFDPLYLIRLGLCADLREADLRGADLRRADLAGVDLRGVDLSRASLRGADLTGALNIPASAVGGIR